MDVEPLDISASMGTPGEEGSYAFTCPACGSDVEVPATQKIVALLIAAGARTRPGEVDDQLAPEDRSPDPDAPPFTLDDVIELHFLLEGEIGPADLLRPRAGGSRPGRRGRAA